MSSYVCEKCDVAIIEKDGRYVTECEHYPKMGKDMEKGRIEFDDPTFRAAKMFHDTYERLAPLFGYETRSDTKTFDPESPNGRLMMATIAGMPTRAAELEAELESLKDFVRSLNSLAFEEWHGLYYEDQFHIYDDDSGKSVARGADAYEAWLNLTADKPTDGGIFGPRGLCLNK